ncbi:hypothetical protein L6452_05815 [Arctium lappa]|uniref:Uncharacterized protein n=1 Tax=Arctium lappa TaxID=4217 RepID=A0ACB9EH01_ARCLA|nr:hypothetical protein L6452_05815 [Arctium lappa]
MVLVMVTAMPFNFTTTSSYTIATSPGDVKLVSDDEDQGSSSPTDPTTSNKHLNFFAIDSSLLFCCSSTKSMYLESPREQVYSGKGSAENKMWGKGSLELHNGRKHHCRGSGLKGRQEGSG